MSHTDTDAFGRPAPTDNRPLQGEEEQDRLVRRDVAAREAERVRRWMVTLTFLVITPVLIGLLAAVFLFAFPATSPDAPTLLR